ncbi:MAG: CpaF family protein [Fuscovulum sp.]|jgi:pilus assembly protein CpaF|nr:CpaF family protein [Fuscovulum sp.]
MFKDFVSLGKSGGKPSTVLPFSRPDGNPQPDPLILVTEDPAREAALELKSRMHEVLLDRLNLAAIEKVDPEELRREVSALVNDELRSANMPMRAENFKQLISELMDEVMGLGPLEPLIADPTVNDILVNGHKNVYVERNGILERSRARFRDERHLLRIIEKIVSRVGRRVDESNPWVDARLEDGSRVNAIIRPCAIDGPSLSIRKFSRNPLTLDRLIEIETLTPEAARFMRALVQARMNILISGGTGSGKTTLLNAISAAIDERSRIVTIEDAAELQLQQAHVVRLETRPPNPNGQGAVAQRDLVRNALRMRPDRIIVGEVRGPEAFDMLQAMNTGHDGSMTTVHANSARDAISRIEQMVTMIGLDLPMSAVRSQIASGVHVVIHAARLSDGRRRIMSISEITGMEGNVITMQDIFVFRRLGKSDDGRILGDFTATGIRPHCMDTLVSSGVSVDPADFIPRR